MQTIHPHFDKRSTQWAVNSAGCIALQHAEEFASSANDAAWDSGMPYSPKPSIGRNSLSANSSTYPRVRNPSSSLARNGPRFLPSATPPSRGSFVFVAERQGWHSAHPCASPFGRPSVVQNGCPAVLSNPGTSRALQFQPSTKIKKPHKGAFLFWRRGRDSNPGTPVRMLLEFQSSAFDRSATSPVRREGYSGDLR